MAWDGDGAEVTYLARGGDPQGRILDDDRLLELMLGSAGGDLTPVKIGIDAPLGWPVAFVAAVADLDAWPLWEQVPQERLVRRATDRWVIREAGKIPLSVSTDRIAYPAMRAVRLIRRWQDVTGQRIDRTGVSGPIAEVYPDTAVTRFGLRGSERRLSYKGSSATDVRATMLETLQKQAPWLALSAARRQDCITSDDCFDALIAALLTRAVQLGLTVPPPPEMAQEAATEGWIHLPAQTGLARLAPGS